MIKKHAPRHNSHTFSLKDEGVSEHPFTRVKNLNSWEVSLPEGEEVTEVSVRVEEQVKGELAVETYRLLPQRETSFSGWGDRGDGGDGPFD